MSLKINFLGKTFKNPIIPASGTFGFGYEFASFYDINILGSISLKGTTLEPRYGNPLPRIAECPSGLVNAIGLQNPGVDKVVNEELGKLKEVYNDLVIANVGGHSVTEYVETCKKFNDAETVFAVELNISCPNVKGGGMAPWRIIPKRWSLMPIRMRSSTLSIASPRVSPRIDVLRSSL